MVYRNVLGKYDSEEIRRELIVNSVKLKLQPQGNTNSGFTILLDLAVHGRLHQQTYHHSEPEHNTTLGSHALDSIVVGNTITLYFVSVV